MKKRQSMFGLLMAAIFLAVVVSGCGTSASSGQGGAAAASASQGEGQLRVALILSGTISDQGWNAMAYNGLKEIEQKYGAEVKYKESVGKSDMEEAFRTYATEGFDIVFGHGFEFSDTAKIVGPDFPDTIFLVTSSDVSQAPNVGAVTNSNEEVGFLLGVVGAYSTKTKNIGSLNGMESPQIVASMRGIRAGIDYVDPEIQYASLYTGSFEDAAKAKEMALAMFNSGTDVIQGDPNQMSMGILEACDEAGTNFLGVMGDFSKMNEKVVLTSSMVDFGKAMASVVGQIQNGEWEPGVSDFGVKEEVVYLAPLNENVLDKEQIAEINKVLEGIRDGSIDVDALIEKSAAAA